MAAPDFEWDPVKAAANLRKHGVDFADAVTVLEDEAAVTVWDPDAAGEERLVTVGMDATGRVLVVISTPRGERIRIISARCASRAEQRQYWARH